MIQLFDGIENRAIVTKTIATYARAKSLTQQVHTALTSPQAISAYKLVGRTIATVALLSIASILLVIDAGKAIHQWCEAHSDYTYEDFESIAAAKVQKVAGTVKGWLRGQRDRASLFVSSTAERVEKRVRNKVGEVLMELGDRVLPGCPNNICQVNVDEV